MTNCLTGRSVYDNFVLTNSPIWLPRLQYPAYLLPLPRAARMRWVRPVRCPRGVRRLPGPLALLRGGGAHSLHLARPPDRPAAAQRDNAGALAVHQPRLACTEPTCPPAGRGGEGGGVAAAAAAGGGSAASASRSPRPRPEVQPRVSAQRAGPSPGRRCGCGERRAGTAQPVRGGGGGVSEWWWVGWVCVRGGPGGQCGLGGCYPRRVAAGPGGRQQQQQPGNWAGVQAGHQLQANTEDRRG